MSANLPFPFTDKHPKFRVPGWRELLGAHESIGAADMARHFLITGETGSGKSVSAVMRLLEAILRYPEKEPYRAYAKELGDAAERDRGAPDTFDVRHAGSRTEEPLRPLRLRAKQPEAETGRQKRDVELAADHHQNRDA